MPTAELLLPMVIDAFPVRRSIAQYAQSHAQDLDQLVSQATLTGPVSVAPELLNEVSMAHLRKVEDELGLPINLGIGVAHSGVVIDGTEIPAVPFHVYTTFDYGNMTFAGPAIPSLGHRVMTEPDILPERKQQIIEEAMIELISKYDGVVIALQPLKDDSFTEKIFTNESLGAVPFCIIDDKRSVYYYFQSHASSSEVIKDEDFLRIVSHINRAWQENLMRYRENVDVVESARRNEITGDYLKRVFVNPN